MCHTAHPDLMNTLGELDVDYEQARRLTLQRGSDGRIMIIFHVNEEKAPALAYRLAIERQSDIAGQFANKSDRRPLQQPSSSPTVLSA